MDEKPNVFIVVADCLRADEFDREARTSSFLSSLQRSVVAFTECASVSNWTVPAHATLLTGLYPQEHHLHRFGLNALSSELPSIPSSLRGLGYSTQLVSANHNLRPETGFANGFDQVAFGIWGETSLRITSSSHPPFDTSSNMGEDRLRGHLHDEDPTGPWKLGKFAAEILPRFPWVLSGISRIHSGLLHGGLTDDFRVAPWVESSLARFIRTTPSDRPLFSLMNLMDCHEPYLPEVGAAAGLADRWRLSTSRQDIAAWARGRWRPSRRELSTLLELYRQKVHRVGQRIEDIVNILKRTGRWENSVFIVTSDHGQAFGEHGQLFHGGELFEPCVHVPLWLRYPHDEHGGTVVESMSSLVDIYPTIMKAVGGVPGGRVSGIELGQLVNIPRKEPVLSVADGVTGYGVLRSPESELRRSPQVAVYTGNYKLMYDAWSGRFRAYQLTEDPDEGSDLLRTDRTALRGPRAIASQVGGMMLQPTSAGIDVSASNRLRGWGYFD
jgi:arylsulfatase A-like enzyme